MLICIIAFLLMKKYYILAVITVVVYFTVPFFLSTGGVVIDSLSYFGISSDLPAVKTNLFPLGFPAFIEIFHLIFNDYFWASKFAVSLLLVILMIFSYLKNFYFRETVLLCAGKIFFYIFTGIFSESLFIFLLYFLIYYIKNIFGNHKATLRNSLIAGLILILMFTVRYSGIYILAALWFFLIGSIIKDKKQHYLKPLFISAIISSLGILSYLTVNYTFFGSFTGENLRGKPMQILTVDIFRNIFGAVNAFNPYIGIKPASNSVASFTFQIVLCTIDILLIRFYIKYLRKAKNDPDISFHIFLLTLSLTYIFALFFSGFLQQIEELNIRMLAPANLCLFFSFLLLYFKYEKKPDKIFVIGCLFFVFLSFYMLKTPENFLANRNEILPQMKKFRNKKYLYNDEVAQKTFTDYQIPLLKKTFKYEHSGNQAGMVKMNIAGSINPQIKWILNDTVKNKSEVLYTSELILTLKRK